MEEKKVDEKINNFNKLPINFQEIIGYCSQSKKKKKLYKIFICLIF